MFWGFEKHLRRFSRLFRSCKAGVVGSNPTGGSAPPDNHLPFLRPPAGLHRAVVVKTEGGCAVRWVRGTGSSRDRECVWALTPPAACARAPRHPERTKRARMPCSTSARVNTFAAECVFGCRSHPAPSTLFPPTAVSQRFSPTRKPLPLAARCSPIDHPFLRPPPCLHTEVIAKTGDGRRERRRGIRRLRPAC